MSAVQKASVSLDEEDPCFGEGVRNWRVNTSSLYCSIPWNLNLIVVFLKLPATIIAGQLPVT